MSDDLTVDEASRVIGTAVQWRDDWRTTDDSDLIETVQGIVYSHTDPLRRQVERLRSALAENEAAYVRCNARAERRRDALAEANVDRMQERDAAERTLADLRAGIERVPGWLQANGMHPQDVAFVKANLDALLTERRS